MKKILKWLACMTATLTLVTGLGGCEMEFTTVTVTSMEKTATDGLVDTYTITYSDGTQTTFEVTNGQDGKDGEKGADGKDGQDGEKGADGKDGQDGTLSVDDLFAEYKEQYGDITYAEFLEIYFAIGEKEYTSVHATMLSTAKVYTQFPEIDSTTKQEKNAVYTGGAVIYKINSDYTYFLTNYHVVYDQDSTGDKICATPYCYLYGNTGAPKKTNGEVTYGEYAIATAYVGGSISHDMALLRANTEDVLAINENVKAVTFASDYKVGETAIAIGNPDGDGISVTKGIVSVDSEMISLDLDGTVRSYRSMRMDTSVYGGNSGGGLFNANGELIGLVNAKSTENDNMTYAIPLQRVQACADNLLKNQASKTIQTVTFGMTTTAQNSKYVYDTDKGYGSISEEVLVTEVKANSVAETIGLQAGDILTGLTINQTNYALTRFYQLGEYKLYIQIGDTVTITYLRGGQEYVTNELRVSVLGAIEE